MGREIFRRFAGHHDYPWLCKGIIHGFIPCRSNTVVFRRLLTAMALGPFHAQNQSDNKRNGYQPERDYVLKGVGALKIRIPKDRLGRFESIIVPPNERVDPRIKAEMAILQLASLSSRTLSMISKRLLGVEVGKDTVNGIDR